jgi:pimeloyl-ACP methyl ester carboxylesterase
MVHSTSPSRKYINEVSYLEYNPNGSKTIVFLHGLGATAESWILQVPVLIAANYRVLCLDIPGFGKSTWTGRTWTVKKAATFLSDALEKSITGGYDLVGLSMGGVFAQQLAIDHNESLKKLVLVNTFARLGPGRPDQWIYYIRRYYTVALHGLKPQADMVARRIFPDEDQQIYRQVLVAQILEGDDRTYLQALRSLGLINLERKIRRIGNSTLVVTGAEDSTVPIDAQSRLVELIPGSRHVIIQGAGHAVTVDHADEFNRVLLDFLAVDEVKPDL